MNNLRGLTIYSLFFLTLSVINVSAQQTEAQRAAAENQRRQQETIRDRRVDAIKSSQNPFGKNTRETGSGRKNPDGTPYVPIYIAVEMPLTPEDAAKITPSPEEFERFREFLKRSETGLAKILPDPQCGSEYVVDLNDTNCAEAPSMPGRGAFYSFRLGKNFPSPYADIHYMDGDFTVGGRSELSIISDLGDVSLDAIKLNSPEVTFIRDFLPAKTEAKINEQAERVKSVYRAENLVYSDKAPALLNHTYVVRTIAFWHYEQFYNDKRMDILTAFRVVRRDADGALTILWHRLSKHNSPKIIK